MDGRQSLRGCVGANRPSATNGKERRRLRHHLYNAVLLHFIFFLVSSSSALTLLAHELAASGAAFWLRSSRRTGKIVRVLRRAPGHSYSAFTYCKGPSATRIREDEKCAHPPPHALARPLHLHSRARQFTRRASWQNISQTVDRRLTTAAGCARTRTPLSSTRT
ncbi:hypothetical protein BC628DRAFT_1396387 [Trametes gibbosa]|nr:hypothetical protein BC628DRAFT_1396387 [Trametes gibbosa]